MENKGFAKAWIIGIIFGIIGIALSAFLFYLTVLATGHVYGILSIIIGAISGGLFCFGYKFGREIISHAEAKSLIYASAIIGMIGMLAAYFGQAILIVFEMIFSGELSPSNIFFVFRLYSVLIGFGLFDILFVAIGGLGGLWAANRIVGTFFTIQGTAIAQKTEPEQVKPLKQKAKKKRK